MDHSVPFGFLCLIWILMSPGTFCDAADSQVLFHTNIHIHSNYVSGLPEPGDNATTFSDKGVLLTFNPADSLDVQMDDSATSRINYTLFCDTERVSYVINFKSIKPSVAFLMGATSFRTACVSHDDSRNNTYNTTYPVVIEGNVNISVFGELLGRTKLEIEVLRFVNNTNAEPNSDLTDSHHPTTVTSNRYIFEYPVLVRREQKPINTAFRVIISIFAVFSAIAMGCKTDLRVVAADLKKPFAPAIGLFCQYIVMPMIAFTISSTVPFEDPIMRFGIFALGCSPGGGNSNVYTYLLDGDVSLSVTMTTISSFLSLGLFPLWILTVGRQFLPEDDDIHIPFLNVFLSILLVVIPLAIGIAIQFKAPNFAIKFVKYAKPPLLLLLIAVGVLMVIANLYMFQLFTPTTILAGSCLPYFGYFLGGTIAWITRHPWKRIKTIAIETGLQNMGIAMITLMFSLPTPDNEIAMACPAASGMMSIFLVGTVVAIYMTQKKCKEKFYKKVSMDEASDIEDSDDLSPKFDKPKHIDNISDKIELKVLNNNV